MQTSVSFYNEESSFLDLYLQDGWEYVDMVSAGCGSGGDHGRSNFVVTTVILKMDDTEYRQKGYPARFDVLRSMNESAQ